MEFTTVSRRLKDNLGIEFIGFPIKSGVEARGISERLVFGWGDTILMVLLLAVMLGLGLLLAMKSGGESDVNWESPVAAGLVEFCAGPAFEPQIVTAKEGRMRVLVACEFSGRVREAFRALGHDAVSCDLLASEIPGPHIQGDVLEVLDNGWDLMIAHPPCTHLCSSGARWWKAKQIDGRQQRAIEFFQVIMKAPIERIAAENPVGILSKAYRRPDQYVQPYWFGDSVSKKTGLWLKNLPLLKPTNIVNRGEVYVDPRGNSHGGAHTMRAKRCYSPLMLIPECEERWKIRSRTFPGIARTMAEQWGILSRSRAVAADTRINEINL